MAAIEIELSEQAIRLGPGRPRPLLRGRGRPGDRLPRAQRGRQEHHDPDAARARPRRRGLGDLRRARRTATYEHPSAQVGAVLEDASFHPGRSGRNHLRILAAAGGHPAIARAVGARASVGIADAAERRVKGYSMGMRQRLAIAAALLGDPEVLILDEPANGLDPPGIRWMRDLLRSEAARGRAVLVSSHLLSEVVAERRRHRRASRRASCARAGPIDQLIHGGGGAVVRVRAPRLRGRWPRRSTPPGSRTPSGPAGSLLVGGRAGRGGRRGRERGGGSRSPS